MSIDLESLGIRQLSVPERLSLIEQIWDTLPDQVDPSEIPDWHLAELAIRRSSAESQPRQAKHEHDVLNEFE